MANNFNFYGKKKYHHWHHESNSRDHRLCKKEDELVLKKLDSINKTLITMCDAVDGERWKMLLKGQKDEVSIMRARGDLGKWFRLIYVKRKKQTADFIWHWAIMYQHQQNRLLAMTIHLSNKLSCAFDVLLYEYEY